MKNTNKCPKCHSSSIKKAESKVQPFAGGAGVFIPLGMNKPIPVTRYICLKCGYIEEWIDAEEHLEKLASKRVF